MSSILEYKGFFLESAGASAGLPFVTFIVHSPLPKLDKCRFPHSLNESRRLAALGAIIGSPLEPRVNAINTRTVSKRKS